MKPKVFISISSAMDAKERAAEDAIFRSLELAGLAPIRMERNKWSSDQPLRAIREAIRECSGIVVVVFPRYSFSEGSVRLKTGGEEQLRNIRMPTSWNQIEAAIGYTIGLPLFVIAQNGVRADGLLEEYDWKVFWSDFSEQELQSEAFLGYLGSWRDRVLSHASDAEKQAAAIPDVAATEQDLSKWSIGRWLKELTPNQLKGLIAIYLGSLAAVASVAYKVGAKAWHLP